MALFDDLAFLVGGGVDQAQLELNTFRETEAARSARAGGGLDLLKQVTDLQRDPFSLVPALQAQAAAGGGPLDALFAAGGKPQETGLGPLINQLIQGLSKFAGVTGETPTVSPTAQQGQAAATQTTAGPTTTGGITTGGTTGGTTGDAVGGRAATAQREATFAPPTRDMPTTKPVQPPVGPIDRTLLPQSIQDAITAFEMGVGNITEIGQAVADRNLGAINQVNQVKLATDPTILESSIRSAIGKRQSKRGARNQLATSSVGRAVR